MPPKKKVIKEKKQKKVKQKQSQSQSQKVIINLNEVKTKPKRKKANNKNIKFDEISQNAMPVGWTKYGGQDDRETNTLRGNLNEVQNKLLTIKNVENPVNSDSSRMLKIEEGMKNMALRGYNAIEDLYSKFDNIGDFSNKTNFRNPVKEQQKKQSQPIYAIKKDESKQFFQDDNKKNVGRPKKYETEEERKKAISERNKKTREKMKETKKYKDTANKEIEETELKNIAFKERLDKLRANLKQQKQDADDKFDFQRGFVNKYREQAEQALMGENDDSNLKDDFI